MIKSRMGGRAFRYQAPPLFWNQLHLQSWRLRPLMETEDFPPDGLIVGPEPGSPGET